MKHAHWMDTTKESMFAKLTEQHNIALAALCCMTQLEKWHHLYSGTWGRPTDSTFIEVKRPDKMTHT